MNAKGLIILLLGVTVITGVIFVWYNNQIDLEIPPNTVSHQEKSEGLGATIYTEGRNPIATYAPDSNAISGAVTNPFDTYVNPFEIQ